MTSTTATYTIVVAGCAVLGVAVGSFLNVVIYRVPRRESIVRPRSACPECRVAIANRDNIPIVSWLILRGRCRNCGGPISVRYLLVEVLTALLFIGTALRFGPHWDLPAFLVLTAGLIALGFTDLEHHLLPVRIVYPVLLMVAALMLVATVATGNWSWLVTAAASAAVCFGLFFVVNWVSPRVLGFGDVRLALIFGLGLGWLGVRYVLLGFFAANLIGAVIGVALIVTKRITRSTPIPYGVFLALGTFLAMYSGSAILSNYRGL